ncbi:MAG: hypothetical protein L3K17_05620 [Thermoplasmata archaeon]|nr:hypothetical protein [Thermoplasmata archaeon]
MTRGDRGPIRPDELDGYATGVAARLAERRGSGEPLTEAEALLAEGRGAIARHDWPAADRALRAADALLDRSAPEDVVTQWPRGLARYDAFDRASTLPSRDEDRLSNRGLLAQRLLTLRRTEGHLVDPLIAKLHEAEAAYVRGDRVTAQRLIDRVQGELDSLGR